VGALHNWRASQQRVYLMRGGAMELYSCSSSIGTDGRSLGAISRPATGAADSRFATLVIFVFGGRCRGSGRRCTRGDCGEWAMG
jgi:hypothetical protein